MKQKFLKFLFLLSISFLYCSCTSTNQDLSFEDQSIKFEKIDEYTIEISNISKIKNVYFYIFPKSSPKSQELINQTISNISFEVNGNTYNLKYSLYDSDDVIYCFYLSDSNGKKLSLLELPSSPDKIFLKSKRALTYSDGIAGTSYKVGDKIYGRKKYPYDCLICLNQLKISKNTKEEQDKIDLAREIIVKKYGFKSYTEYVHWLDRTNWNNLYISLSAGSYANKIPFVEGDIVFVKEIFLLTIEYMRDTGKEYLYLITAGKNQISKCCMIVSERQLNYQMSYYGAFITEPLLLKYIGQNQYQQGYRTQNCDVFIILEEDSKEYNDYFSKINDIAEIERNPNAYKNILEK